MLVAGRDELEEQVRGVRIEREVADLVDDQEPVAAESFEFLLESSRVVCGLEPCDPAGGGVEQDRVAGVAGFDAEPDREVGFADAGWAEQDHVLSLRNERRRCQVMRARRGAARAAGRG